MICPKFNSYVHKLKMWGIEKRLCLLGECPTYTPTNWWWANWNSITHFSFCKVPSYVPPFEKEGSRGFSFWRTLQVRFVRRHFEEPLAWWYTKGAPLNKTQPCIFTKSRISSTLYGRWWTWRGPCSMNLGPTLCRVLFPPNTPKTSPLSQSSLCTRKAISVVFLVLL